jgi:hypothetical protein
MTFALPPSIVYCIYNFFTHSSLRLRINTGFPKKMLKYISTGCYDSGFVSVVVFGLARRINMIVRPPADEKP